MRIQWLIFGFWCVLISSSIWAQRTGSVPPNPGPFQGGLTEKQELLNSEILEFLKIANKRLEACTQGKASFKKNVYDLYNYLVMVDSMGAETIWGRNCCNLSNNEEFFRCVVNEKFSQSIKSIIENPELYPLMTVDKTLNRKHVDRLKKFFEDMIIRYKE